MRHLLLFDLLDPKEGDLVGALPEGFDAWNTEYQLVLRCGLDGNYGETRLFAWDGKLVGATRSSIMSDFVPITMLSPARLRRAGLNTHLILTLVTGEQVEIPVMLADRERIAQLLEAAPGIIEPPAPEPEPAIEPEPAPEESAPEIAPEQATTAGHAQEAPDDEARAKLARQMLEKLREKEEAEAAAAPEQPAAARKKKEEVVLYDFETAARPSVITLPENAILRVGPTRMKRWGGTRDDEHLRALHIGGGDRVLVGTCASSTARAWSLATGEIVRELALDPAHGDIEHSAISPDGRTFVAAYERGKVVIWELGSGIDRLHFDIEAKVTSMAITHDGEALLLGYENGSLSAWGLKDGEPMGMFFFGQDALLAIAASSRHQIIVASNNSELLRCDLHTNEHTRLLRGNEQILGLDLSARGHVLIRGRETIALFDVNAKTMIWGFEQRNARAAHFGHTQETFYVINRAGRVLIYDIDARMVVHALSPKAAPTAMALSSDGKILATGKHRVELFDMPHGDARLPEVGHHAAISHVHISPYGDEIATSSSDGSVLGWSLQPTSLAWELRDGSLGVISPDEKWLAAVRPEGIALWSNAEDREIGLLPGLTGSARDLIFSPKSNFLLAQYWSGPVLVWDLKQSRVHMQCDSSDRTRAVAFDNEEKQLAVAESDGRVVIWSMDSGRERSMLEADTTVAAMAFTPDHMMLATAETRGQVSIWDLSTANTRYRWEYFRENPRNLALSPDGEFLALGCLDGTLILLDLNSGQEVFRATAHEGLITALDFDASGKRIATASVDMNAVLWDLSEWM